MIWSMVKGAAALGMAGAVAVSLPTPEADEPPREAAGEAIERGRYLARIGGCNDCHTPGYAARNAAVPEDRWLVGSPVGFLGPWGTTYPTNLRRYMASLTEEQWVETAGRLKTRPPMPWFNLRAMSETDLRALYRYVRSLPDDDRSVPDYLPPGEEPATAHIVLVPQSPQR